MRAAAGLVLGGRYRLVRQIAVGGMGEVWVAHDEALARDVAAKVLKEEYAGNEDFLDRLRTEARNAAGLSHENIAQLFDYGEQDGSGYLILELVVGEPMSDLLEREPVLPLRRLLPILAQTARGLHAAHVGGVVHRDVKPGNILLEHGSTVKITDFGVSLGANQVPMTATGMVMGTAQYLSPEQAIGRPATGASDVYALGIVAYESVVGHRPFTGATAVDIAVAHVNEAVPPLPATVHVGLATLIMQMLEKDPEKRPRSAAALALRLDELARVVELDPFGHLAERVARHVSAGGSPVSGASGASPRSAPSTATPRPALPRPTTRTPVPTTPAGTSAPAAPPSFAPRTRREMYGRTGTPSGGTRSAPPPPRPPAPPSEAPGSTSLPSAAAPAPVGSSAGPSGAVVRPAVGTSSASTGAPLRARRAPSEAGTAHPGPGGPGFVAADGRPWAPSRVDLPGRPPTATSPVARRAAAPGAVPPPPRPAPGPTGLRLGRLSWPLAGLLAIVSLILVVALLTGAAGPGAASWAGALLVPLPSRLRGTGGACAPSDDKIAAAVRTARDRSVVPLTTKDD